MVKALLHAHDFECDAGEDEDEVPWECELLPILYDIINVQNAQIMDMRGVLEALGTFTVHKTYSFFGQMIFFSSFCILFFIFV